MRQAGGAPGPNPALAASRVARAGGYILEAVGQLRFEARDFSTAELHRARAERLQRVADRICRVHGFDVTVRGKLPQVPSVLVANHVSYVDAPIVAALAPCVPIAKDELAGWPFVGAGARSLGVVFVRRGDAWSGARALRAAMRALASGVSVLGFPEGTTTRGDDPLPFRRGLFGVARLAGAPIVPVAIAYASPDVAWIGEDWFLPHYLRTAMRARTAATITLGAPLAPDAYGCAEDLAHAARSRIAQLLRRPHS